MSSPRKGRWAAAAAVALLAAGAAVGYCTLTDGCSVGRAADTRPKTKARKAPTAKASQTAYSTSTSETPKTRGKHAMNPIAAQAKPRPAVHHADTDNFHQLVLKSEVPVLVDFYADWCGPCRRIAPALEQVAAEVPGAKIVKVNVDNSPDLAMRYGVDSIPSLKVFKGGRVAAEHVGMASKDELKALIAR